MSLPTNAELADYLKGLSCASSIDLGSSDGQVSIALRRAANRLLAASEVVGAAGLLFPNERRDGVFSFEKMGHEVHEEARLCRALNAYVDSLSKETQ